MMGKENIHVGSSHPKVFFEVNVLTLWMAYLKNYVYCS